MFRPVFIKYYWSIIETKTNNQNWDGPGCAGPWAGGGASCIKTNKIKLLRLQRKSVNWRLKKVRKGKYHKHTHGLISCSLSNVEIQKLRYSSLWCNSINNIHKSMYVHCTSLRGAEHWTLQDAVLCWELWLVVTVYCEMIKFSSEKRSSIFFYIFRTQNCFKTHLEKM